ncbi:LysM peptidoglycan-binding domain-containing protein [Aureimonas sp. ME7]|uniref:LysM peptidoglycan-binding domain-containing protein n=1 Tax=Aureimonas sp. ME7 TaxID=2744252 RepID=UPI0015F61243|nr:LysM peptidoglycan-binding domain-containing protein [Aureimonas sp. ME7]
MIRRKGPLLAVAVIAAFALGWYRGLFGLDQVVETAGTPVAPPSATPPAAPSPSPPAAQSPASAEVPPAAEAAKGSQAPGFDVVRVEPDGSAVIAGRGAANEKVALSDGVRSYGEAQTDANGDFVMTLSLPTGSRRLQLEQPGTGGVSQDAAVVNVPPKDRSHELLVMMERAGQPAEVLVRPEAAPAPSPSIAAPTQPDTAEVATAEAKAAPAPAPVAPPGTLAVEAVEVEGGKLFIAGAAPETSKVRVYLDDKLVAETKGGEGERFIASAAAQVPIGDHTIRADEVNASGQVVGRVEVPFQRPNDEPMAAVASAASPSIKAGDVPASEAATAGSAADLSGLRTTVQAPLEAAPPRVIIRRGDTLWRISRATYGRGSRYTVIYLANGDQIRDPNRIYPGQIFRMPNGDEAERKG